MRVLLGPAPWSPDAFTQVFELQPPRRCSVIDVDVRDVIDDALEVSIVGSFTNAGYAARRWLYGWRDSEPGSLRGQVVAITGPTSGLGRATTDALAAAGARIILIGRSEDRLRALRDELGAAHGEDRFQIVVADMGSLRSVSAAVTQIRDTEPGLDVLIDNAGAIYPERTVGPDGIEATLALLVVGPFALISGLLPLLRAGGNGRVVSVTSGGMYTQAVDLEDLQGESEAFSGARAYARAKRIQIALTREWGRRLVGSGVTVNAMHPGWADTPGLAESLPDFYRAMHRFLRTPQQGADTAVWLAAHPDARDFTGRLFLDRRPRPFDRVPRTRLSAADRRRIWDMVVRLAGIPDPVPDH
jgi:NAD(P)-dependent dehydrogenase (short-subunit alcohol dehydrogenase family)